MKLLRLTTQDEDAFFDNSFNDDLVIKKSSKISLQSLQIETKVNVITINQVNEIIKYQTSNSEGEKSIKLNNQTYTETNFRDLFLDIQNKLNDNTGVLPSPNNENKNYGMEWLVSEDRQNKIFVEYKIGNYREHTSSWKYDTSLVERLATGVWRQKASTADDNSNNRNATFPEYISTGCGFIRCRTNKFDNAVAPASNDASGYIIGLSKVNLTNVNSINNSDLNYGIQVAVDTNGARKYFIIENGTPTVSTEIPGFVAEGDVANDFQEVMINFDKVHINIYTGGSAVATLVKEWDYTTGEKLYPFIIFRGKNCNLNALNLTPSPYSSIPANSENDNRLGAPPRPVRIATNNFLEMEISLAQFLGYNSARQPLSGFINAVNVTYLADNKFEAIDKGDSFLVELMNLKVESYDGLKQQRKNILGIINQSDKDGVILYETNTPLFIDLDNSDDILLRNIKVRVLKSDYSTLKMKGEASMVILIDN